MSKKIKVRNLCLTVITNGKDETHKFFPLVHGVARAEVRRTGTPVDYEDILAAGLLGLVKAANEYSTSWETKFSTYATRRVRGEVLDLIRKEAVKARQLPRGELPEGVEPSAKSLVEPCIARRELVDEVLRVMSRELPPSDQRLLLMFYFQNKSERQIARKLRCSVSWVDKAKTAAVSKLRSSLASKGFLNGIHH